MHTFLNYTNLTIARWICVDLALPLSSTQYPSGIGAIKSALGLFMLIGQNMHSTPAYISLDQANHGVAEIPNPVGEKAKTSLPSKNMQSTLRCSCFKKRIDATSNS